MTPERHQQIARLFNAALELEATERASFLSTACSGDEALREEIESLLAHAGQSETFIEAPAGQFAAGLLRTESRQPGLGQRIGAYEVLSLLGAGGMGEVYRARDTRLDREVAIKILPASFANDHERLKRFEQEARATSALNHPNILTIYDIGESEMGSFIVMEIIHGRTLTEIIADGAAIDAVTGLGSQIARALEAAHAAGITHRDIKPDNIMVRNDGYVKLLDFGLARLRFPAGSQDEVTMARLTTPGTMMGTVAYMSPEQLRGEQFGHPSDIFALGIVLYELATGRHPFNAESLLGYLHAISLQTPVPLTSLNPTLPVVLDELILKMLDKDPGNRPSAGEVAQSLQEIERLGEGSNRPVSQPHLVASRNNLAPHGLESEPGAGGKSEMFRALDVTQEDEKPQQTSKGKVAGLPSLEPGFVSGDSPNRWIARAPWRNGRVLLLSGALLILLVIIGTGFYLARRAWVPVETSAIDSIAILPLVNATAGNADMEYLSDGITEGIINALSQLPRLKVTPRVSVFRYKGRSVDPRVVAREMGVRAVMTGKVVQFGDRVSIQTDLIDAEGNSQLWGAKYDRRLSELLTVQDEIATEVSNKLRLRLSGEEKQRISKRFTDNTEAYQLYLKGRYHWKKYSQDGLEKSITFYKQAIEKEPGYALAYSGLADAYVLLGIGYLPPRETFPKAKAAAQKAISIDDELAAGHISMGACKFYYDWDWEGAQKEVQRAKNLNSAYESGIEINTNYDDEHHFYCQALDTIGRPQDSIAEMRRALKLDPLSLSMILEVGWSLYISRNYDEAIAQCRKAIELDPNYIAAYPCVAQAYEQKKQYAEAISDMKKAKALAENDPLVTTELACAYALAGQKGEARKLLDVLKERSMKDFVDPGLIAVIFTSLGEKDQAFLWLDKAYQARSSWMTWLKVEPKFDPIRSDPRFAVLVRKVGFI